MTMKDPFIFNFVLEFKLLIFFFQFASFFFFFFKYGEAGSPPSSSPLHPAPAFTCIPPILFCDSLT